jgi:hypothetical protein
MVQKLLQAGADTEVRSRSAGATPLFFATGSYDAVCVRLLLSAGADVEATNDEGDTAQDCIDFRPTSVTNRAIRRRMTRPPDDFNGRARHMERDEGRSFRTEQEQTAITTPSEGVRARLARELRAGTLSAEVLALFDATDSQKQADLALRRRTVSAHDLD